MTDIEQFLFGGNMAHGIVEFSLAPGRIRLGLAPWETGGVHPNLSTEAVFVNSKILWLWQIEEPDEEDLNLPWDIIGLDGYVLQGGRWKFVLNCGGIELGWESEWPRVKRGVA
jgi:hypothetical protein